VQTLKEYVIRYLITLLNGIAGTERILIGIGSPRGTLVNKFLVAGFFRETTVQEFL